MSSEIKTTNIKHADSASNNLVLASDGTTTVNGALTASGGIKVADGGNIGSASDADAISISSGGLVVDSARPYFWYIGTGGDVSVNDDARIPFGTLVDQRGDDFNTTSHWFLTPIAGIYTISAQLYLYSTTGSSQDWMLVTNNSTGGGTETELARARHPSSTIGQIIRIVFTGYISANKTVSVRNNAGGSRNVYLSNVSHTSFFGALIG